MKKEKLESFLFMLSLGLCMTSCVFVLLVSYSYCREKNTKLEDAKIKAQQEANLAAKKVDKQLEVLKDQQNLNTNRNEWQDFRLNKLEGRGDQEP